MWHLCTEYVSCMSYLVASEKLSVAWRFRTKTIFNLYQKSNHFLGIGKISLQTRLWTKRFGCSSSNSYSKETMFPHPYLFRWGHPHGKEWPKGLRRHSPLSKTPIKVDKLWENFETILESKGNLQKKNIRTRTFVVLFSDNCSFLKGINFKKPSVFHTRNRGFGQPANPYWSPWIFFWGTKPYKNRLPIKSQKGNKHQNHQTSSKVSFHFWPFFSRFFQKP